MAVTAWHLLPPTITEKYPVHNGLVTSLTRELTVFGDDTSLQVLESPQIPFGTKYLWQGGHFNVTTDPAVRDLWTAQGLSWEVVYV